MRRISGFGILELEAKCWVKKTLRNGAGRPCDTLLLNDLDLYMTPSETPAPVVDGVVLDSGLGPGRNRANDMRTLAVCGKQFGVPELEAVSRTARILEFEDLLLEAWTKYRMPGGTHVPQVNHQLFGLTVTPDLKKVLVA
jgi:hypothetical protein